LLLAQHPDLPPVSRSVGPVVQQEATLSTATIATFSSAADITEYVDFLQDLQPGEGGELKLQDGDKVRVVKRRLSTAATRLQKKIHWRPLRNGALQFEVR
jgi:hypothetical protein